MRIEPARPADLPAAESLLERAGLPLDGVRAALALGVVARADEGVVGAAGLERYGRAALLRSVVVREDRRGSGIGRDLVAAAEGRARDAGVEVLYLLTETAERWFPGLGYEPVARSEVPAPIAGSTEFTTACASTAVAMVKRLA